VLQYNLTFIASVSSDEKSSPFLWRFFKAFLAPGVRTKINFVWFFSIFKNPWKMKWSDNKKQVWTITSDNATIDRVESGLVSRSQKCPANSNSEFGSSYYNFPTRLILPKFSKNICYQKRKEKLTRFWHWKFNSTPISRLSKLLNRLTSPGYNLEIIWLRYRGRGFTLWWWVGLATLCVQSSE